MTEYVTKDKINSGKIEDIRLGGAAEYLFSKLVYQRVTSDYAKNVVYKECEDFFRSKQDDRHSYGIWQGEFWGKWVISAARVARYNHDDSLKEFLRKAAYGLISTAREDGYIGTYADSLNMFKADTSLSEKEVGWKCEWNWNVWCRKYTLWGLLEVYMLTEDEKILEAAKKHADCLTDELKKLNTHLCFVGVMSGLAAFSILKPMLILYRITEDKKYLDFCLAETDMWDKPDGSRPNLITNGLANIPVHEWYSETWIRKAYEMMSCLDGILELYRVTGVKKYLTAVENIYTQLVRHELNPMFGVGYNDQFNRAAYKINGISEPCDTIHWIRICYELFKLTGEMKYMDSIELAFYNAFLAGTFEDGRWGARGIRSAGRHFVAHGQAETKYQHCCVNNLPRGFINAAECFAMYSDDCVYINLLTDYDGQLDTPFGKVKISIGGRLFKGGNAEIRVKAESETALKIRIPSWSKKSVVAVDGVKKDAVCGEYFNVEVEAGSHTIELFLEIEEKIVDFAREVDLDEEFNPETFRYWIVKSKFSVEKEIAADKKSSKIMYGPLLLTRSKLIGNTEDEMFSGETICQKNYSVALTPVDSDKVSYLFKAEFDGEKPFETLMCDYASGTNFELCDDDRYFNIYL